MFKRIVCLFFICTLIGCEKELILQEKNTSDINIAAKRGSAGDSAGQYNQGSDGGTTNPSTPTESSGDDKNGEDGGTNPNAPTGGNGDDVTGGGGGVTFGSHQYLGAYVGNMNSNTQIMNITNLDNVPCMPEVPFFLSGSATGSGGPYSATVLFELNSSFTNVDFDVLDIIWEANGSTSSGEDLSLSGLAEEEVVSILCEVYTTDGNYIYRSDMEFDVFVYELVADEPPLDINGTPVNIDVDIPYWVGTHLALGNGNVESGLCGSGEGTFAIIVPYAEP